MLTKVIKSNVIRLLLSYRRKVQESRLMVVVV